jgi:hypothetical protein
MRIAKLVKRGESAKGFFNQSVDETVIGSCVPVGLGLATG